MDIARLARNLDAVISPYYVFMHFWIFLFGDSDLALRLPPLLATALGVGVVAGLGRRLAGPGTGIVAGLLLSPVPMLSFQGLQARPYGFTLLCTMLATLTLYRALDNPSWRRWSVYGLCVLLVGVFQVTDLAQTSAIDQHRQ